MSPAALVDLVAQSPPWIVAAGVTWLCFRLEVLGGQLRRHARVLELLKAGHCGDRFTHANLSTTLQEHRTNASH